MRVTTVQITFRAAFDRLNDVEALESAMKQIVEGAELQIVDHVRHSFSPQGHSTAFILSESHIAAHTWPESETAYITLSSCSGVSLSQAALEKLLSEHLEATSVEIQEMHDDV